MLSKLVVALVVAIQGVSPSLSHTTALKYARWVDRTAHERRLDPWIFVAIVDHETRWDARVVRHEHDGTCSVGLGQINVPCGDSYIAPLQDPRVNIRRMGKILQHLKSHCRYACEDLGWLRGYNPGSEQYLAGVQAEIRRHHDSR